MFKWRLILLFFVIASVCWWWLQPVKYQLEVINRSDKTVDQVRLFGSGARDNKVIINLLPGLRAVAVVNLTGEGGLKFEVTQGLNRIDTFITEDVSRMPFSWQQFLLKTAYQQQLEIHPNNRFIIRDYRDSVLAD